MITSDIQRWYDKNKIIFSGYLDHYKNNKDAVEQLKDQYPEYNWYLMVEILLTIINALRNKLAICNKALDYYEGVDETEIDYGDEL